MNDLTTLGSKSSFIDMRQVFVSFSYYCRSVFSQWVTLLTGGMIALGMGIWQQWRGSISSPRYIAVLIITLFVACFLTWLKENRLRLASDQALLDHLDELIHCLVITAEVADQFLTKGKDLMGRIILTNTSNKALEYGPSDFRGIFGDDEPINIKGGKQVLSAGQTVYYEVRFGEMAMASKNAFVLFDIRTVYGPAGRPSTREITKKIKVDYEINEGLYVANFAARDVYHSDKPIGGK